MIEGQPAMFLSIWYNWPISPSASSASEEQHNEMLMLMLMLTARAIKIPAPKKYTGKKNQHLREKLNCSQKVFGNIVGVTADTISKWEREVRTPDKIACRFLKVIEREGLRAIK